MNTEQTQEHLKINPTNPPHPLCSTTNFRQKIQNNNEQFESLITTNNKQYNIPQNSPISTIFSNIFILTFDKTIHTYISNINDNYKQYSDNIMIIYAPHFQDHMIKFVRHKIKKLDNKIKLNEKKTKISTFERQHNISNYNQPITYLKFTFDGQKIFLQKQTLSHYYKHMNYTTKHTTKKTQNKNNTSIFKHKLYQKFTHLKTDNFYSYAKQSSQILNDQTPKLQLRQHFTILHQKLNNHKH